VTSLNGLEIEQPADWLEVPPRPDGGPDLVGLAGVPDEVELDRKALRCFGPAKLISEVPLVHDWELECLRGGNALTLQVPANRLAGIRCEATAYALILCDDNRVQPNEVFEADPGSYLLVARRGGFEAQRLPFVVPRLERVELCPKLLPAGSTPTGFVYVPPGKFVYGGDPEAREPGPPEELELPGYFIGRREVTNREWFEFLEDPEIEQRMQGAKQPIYVPRELRGVMPRENLGGPVTPVMGVSWNDIHDFLAWRNTLARAAGEPWVYDLPSQQEWEKAARGVDGRLFPWGDRFDFANVVGLYRKPRHLYDAPGGFEPRDESPFGVQDAGGHRQEWTRDRYGTDPKAPPMYRVRGGGWQTSSDLDFRTASRGFWTATTVHGNVGFRLVARLRPGESSDQ
jgi:formylglycine-generating enzyme required for sulfatase activity